MSRKKSIFFLLFIFHVSISTAQNVGDTIPNYTFSDVINGESLTIEELRGKKSLLIEFWATWCGPCIPAMDHLEKIQKRYSDQLEIITVSSDVREKLVRYLESTKSKLKVAYDTSHLSVFSYSSIPHTILIDHQGIIKGITRPSQIMPQTIDDLISGRPLSLEKNSMTHDSFRTDTLYQFEDERKKLIVTTFQKGRTTRVKTSLTDNDEPYKYIIDNMGIVSIYRELSQTVSSARIVFLDNLTYDDFPYTPENLLCLEIEYLVNETDLINMEVFDLLNPMFDVKARKSKRKVDHYELTQTQKILQNSMSDTPHLTFGGPHYSSKKQPIDQLAFYLENVSQTPVINSTGLVGNYDLELQWQLEAPETVNIELAKYGLHIEKVKRCKRKKIAVLEVYIAD